MSAYLQNTLRRVLDKRASQTSPSQEDIFTQVKDTLPGRPVHASGGLPDARGLSDVDISLYNRNYTDMLGQFPEGTSAEHKPGRSIYSIPGYERPVAVYVSNEIKRLNRALRHRRTELALAEQYPDLASEAYKVKQTGMGTEKAWASVLGAEGDPYEALLNKRKMLRLAARTSAERMLRDKTAAYALPTLAPKWSEQGHITAALRQHLTDTEAALGTELEAKELADLYLITDAYRRNFVDRALLRQRFGKFKKYADGPSLATPRRLTDKVSAAGHHLAGTKLSSGYTVNPELMEHLNTKVIPEYAAFDEAHRENHARTVLTEALRMGEIHGADPDMVAAAAAYHDLGLKIGDRDTHHINSERLIKKDRELRRFFKKKQIAEIALAARQHRASLDEPVDSLLSKIVGDADRSPDIDSMIGRTIQYRKDRNMSRDDMFRDSYEHLVEKFGEDGYVKYRLPETLQNPDIVRVRKLLKNKAATRRVFNRLYRDIMTPP